LSFDDPPSFLSKIALMRYRLRSLLIVLALGPLLIAVLYWANERIAVQTPGEDSEAEQQELKEYRERNWVMDDDGTWHDRSIPQVPE